jgi:SNF2 family DNA or RNA helicase
VANAYPSDKILKRIAGKKLNQEEWAKEFDAHLGELFGNEFFRVVLDEGHAIRNYHTKTARACIHLTSKYRWILTGTPIHNSLEGTSRQYERFSLHFVWWANEKGDLELYSYFRFLGAHWAASREEFAKQFGVRKPEVIHALIPPFPDTKLPAIC